VSIAGLRSPRNSSGSPPSCSMRSVVHECGP
jgi:hypothetical protein